VYALQSSLGPRFQGNAHASCHADRPTRLRRAI